MMSSIYRSRVALLTPRGRGAVATIAVSGSEAATVVDRFFRSATKRTLADAPTNTILFGRWNGESGEEVVVCRTDVEQVEIHCHGGLAAADAIVETLQAAGASLEDANASLVRRARGRLEADALAMLPHARTLRCAAILHDQACGAMREVLERIITSNDIALAELDTLISRSVIGRHLVEPFRVVIGGAPNVGKSSLVNALVGYQRAIVFDEPGTTRDAVTAVTALEGWPVELCDTAGMRDEAESVEQLGIERAVERLDAADCRVLVFDRSRPWTEADAAMLSQWPDALIVHNKADLSGNVTARPAGLAVSALSGEGIDALIAAIVERLVPIAPTPGIAVPISNEQVEALIEAREALARGDRNSARIALKQLLDAC
jgi:tRNA modification GTPase